MAISRIVLSTNSVKPGIEKILSLGPIISSFHIESSSGLKGQNSKKTNQKNYLYFILNFDLSLYMLMYT